MPLNNETIQHPLPGNLQARVENALNLVTSLEAEQARLIKFNESQKSEINSNHAEIKSMEGKISNLKDEISKLEKQVESSSGELNTLFMGIKSAEEDLEKTIAHRKSVWEESVAREKDVQRRESAVEKLEEDVRKRLAVLTENEQKHQRKVEKLLEAIK